MRADPTSTATAWPAISRHAPGRRAAAATSADRLPDRSRRHARGPAGRFRRPRATRCSTAPPLSSKAHAAQNGRRAALTRAGPRRAQDRRARGAVAPRPRRTPKMLGSLEITPNLWPTAALLDWLRRSCAVVDGIPAPPNASRKRADPARAPSPAPTLYFSSEAGDFWWWLMVGADANAAKLLLTPRLDAPGWKEDSPRLVVGRGSRATPEARRGSPPRLDRCWARSRSDGSLHEVRGGEGRRAHGQHGRRRGLTGRRGPGRAFHAALAECLGARCCR